MSYSNKFTMKDIFMNGNLKGKFPQFNRRDLEKNNIDDSRIFDECRTLVCNYLGGKIKGDRIVCSDKSDRKVQTILMVCKQVFETIYDNYDSLRRSIKQNKKLYISAHNMDEFKSMDANKFATIIHEVNENMLYNPNFSGELKEPTLRRKQLAWKRKVGFRG